MISFLLVSTVLIPYIQADDEIALNLYYIEKRPNGSKWLVAYEPDEGKDSSIFLRPGEYLNLTQGVIDRAYNPEIVPKIELNIDSNGTSGLALIFYLEFRYFENQFLPTKADVIAHFNSYTTTGRTDEPEHFLVVSTSYTGEPRDIPQTDYGAMIKLSIKLESGSPDDFVEILCGKDGYHSTLTTPYDKAFIEDDSSAEVNMRSCYITAGIVVILLAVIVIILHLRDRKNK